jgi:hypothetical protein
MDAELIQAAGGWDCSVVGEKQGEKKPLGRCCTTSLLPLHQLPGAYVLCAKRMNAGSW